MSRDMEKEREKERREGIIMEDEAGEEEGVIYYEFLNPTTAVLRISKFEEENQLQIIKRLEEATCAFYEASIDALIIDISSASGNNYCFAMSLLNYLFPEYRSFEYAVSHKNKLTGAFDMKASDLFSEFASAGSDLLNNNATLNQLCQMNPQIVGLFSPCAWNEYDSPVDVFHDDSWFLPGDQLSRGGVTANYSSIFTQSCAANSNFFIPGETNSLFLPPSNIILLSDGLCSSSCAVFARFPSSFPSPSHLSLPSFFPFLSSASFLSSFPFPLPSPLLFLLHSPFPFLSLSVPSLTSPSLPLIALFFSFSLVLWDSS